MGAKRWPSESEVNLDLLIAVAMKFLKRWNGYGELSECDVLEFLISGQLIYCFMNQYIMCVYAWMNV